MLRAIVLSGVALAVCACAPLAGVRPGAPEADARRAMGQPALELENPDGSRQLAYPTGPLGTQTFMVTMKGGSVQAIEQVLTDDTFHRIQAGVTTREDVRRMIGPPYRIVRFENLKQHAWDYRFRDTWGYLADFSVMIDDRGIVASKVIARIEPRDSAGMNR